MGGTDGEEVERMILYVLILGFMIGYAWGYGDGLAWREG